MTPIGGKENNMGSITMITGRLGADPDLRETRQGKKVANFTVAVNSPWSKKYGEPDWFDVEAWGKTAEFVNQYLKKGDGVEITGHMRQQKWERDGEKRSRWVLSADRVSFPPSGGKRTKDDDDDVPF